MSGEASLRIIRGLNLSEAREKMNIRCFPLASEERIILAIDDLSFPEGHYLIKLQISES